MDLRELKRFKGIKRVWAGKDKVQGFRDLRIQGFRDFKGSSMIIRDLNRF